MLSIIGLITVVVFLILASIVWSLCAFNTFGKFNIGGDTNSKKAQFVCAMFGLAILQCWFSLLSRITITF